MNEDKSGLIRSQSFQKIFPLFRIFVNPYSNKLLALFREKLSHHNSILFLTFTFLLNQFKTFITFYFFDGSIQKRFSFKLLWRIVSPQFSFSFLSWRACLPSVVVWNFNFKLEISNLSTSTSAASTSTSERNPFQNVSLK